MKQERNAVSFIFAMLLTLIISISVNAETYMPSIKIPTNRNLKGLCIPGEISLVVDGIVFDCYTTGVYSIELEDEEGNVIYSGTINAVEGQSYFIYVPGLNPEEDELG